MNKQDRIAAAHIIVSAASALKNDIVNKYYRLRMRESLPASRKTDSDIFDSVMKCCTIIEGILKEGGRFHDDKDDVIQLAVRLASYSEDFDSDHFVEVLKEDLAYVASAGVIAALRRPYKEQKNFLEFDDDIPF
ncbi:MAG TPA: hypothetical protein PK667_11350 [Nitrosomonas europaea]|uniref:hypothetical protein n=1 Tax=Nitrosomonas europaea TaxID=915 RepID=UPI002491D54B|nr:hypothetical protein [Nitrosomonas europaea]HRN82868.1 hypothetical protein [Nitrosomonas europaea]HRO56839.1 hypothetical protein [Nitrosomonas europaea]HUM74773.1 hypothetical protein [Nitrosomonas europaea]